MLSKAVKLLPTKLGSASVLKTIDIDTPDTRWIGLKTLLWVDQDGKERKWEMAVRKTTGSEGVDAVAIAALLHRPNQEITVPIILQYRPPLKAICVELPAGLIDGEEKAETSARRELYEEVGIGGAAFENRVSVVETSNVVFSDPGMSSANMQLCVLKVDMSEGESMPQQHLEDGEHIEVREAPLAELYSHLQAFEKLGYIVDARLSHFAMGVALARKFL